MALKKSELYSSIWKSCDALRGGMDASQYKDYVLVLLFMKYVSDKYANDPDAVIVIPKSDEPGKGGSFQDMIHWKGHPEIGDRINKIINSMAEANNLVGVINITDFNDSDKLGKGKDMVDRLTRLISIFEKPELDFSRNRAEGDDLLGDAYEYLMKNFAVESGKSKGQFYTPAEVSRVMSKVIGINNATKASQTVYDPTCGSGSLLIKAASESPTGLTVFGQENDNSMAAIANMNMILHDIPTCEIWKDNTLASPHFKNTDGSLKAFDFAVANPPFSYKTWCNGFSPEDDLFQRFDGFGIPPSKQGDYAFLLHLLKSLNSKGKGAIILPHGVLFRGNAEAEIRTNIIKRGYIKGIIGLPANLFYGTGIPACIIIIDKEQAGNSNPIFMIDASKGFMKDGNKNRLREQDIHKIVDVFNNQYELPKYSRMVSFDEIEKNEFNLNIPRYIDSSELEVLQDIEAHLKGGIPSRDVHTFSDYWDVFPSLKGVLFSSFGRDGYLKLNIDIKYLRKTILEHPEFVTFKNAVSEHYDKWKVETLAYLKAIKLNDKPKGIISKISENLLHTFKPLELIESYDVYQRMMEYWSTIMQDDVYRLVIEGWIADNDLIPEQLIINHYFPSERDEIAKLEEDIEEVNRMMEELEEEQDDDNDLLEEVKTDKGKVTKSLLSNRIKDIKQDKDSVSELEVLYKYNTLIEKETVLKAKLKTVNTDLSIKVNAKYKTLTLDEIKTLVVEDKWLTKISEDVQAELDRITQKLTSHLKELTERYAEPLPNLEKDVTELSQQVEGHLKKMGFTW
jgi:type I restriction enzyme M protein